MNRRVVRRTKSVCPECLKTIEAVLVEKEDGIWMEKSCQEHGDFSAVVWEDSAEAYLKWIGQGQWPEETGRDMLKNQKSDGCPHDCGPCSKHCSQMVSVALMTSNQCNINCPVCFTKIEGQPIYMPSTEELCAQIDRAAKILGTGYPLELCGGEPTVREDLDKLIARGKEDGFIHFQLNTNGIRIAQEDGYAQKLKAAGVSVVYLGFEGTDEATYMKKYGRNLLPYKMKAIENCYKAGLPMVFASIVMPDLNGNALLNIVEIAKNYSPVVRGINFQPISYFGTYEQGARITIPRVIRALASGGEMQVEDFSPVDCQHPQCSFQGVFMIDGKGRLKSMGSSSKPSSAKRVREHNSMAWSESRLKVLTIGGMAFMDAWNFDIQRVQRCRIGIISPENGIVPLCSQYLSSTTGEKIHKNIC